MGTRLKTDIFSIIELIHKTVFDDDVIFIPQYITTLLSSQCEYFHEKILPSNICAQPTFRLI